MAFRVNIINGSNNYEFKGLKVEVRPRPFTGQLQRQTGILQRSDIVDAPWAISNFSGVGVAEATPDQPDADNRYYDGVNILVRPGLLCLGPAQVTPTDIAGVHNITGSQEAIGKLFYFADTAVNDRETIAYFVGSTITWTDATATADWKAATTNAQFPVAGMAEMVNGSGQQAVWALRVTAFQNGASRYQLMTSVDGTTWTAIDHVNAADTPSGDTTTSAYGLIAIGSTLYCLKWSNGTVTLRQSTNSGVTWTSTAGGGTVASASAPTRLMKHYDYAGIVRPFFATREGMWYWDGTGIGTFNDYRGDRQSNNGQNSIVWKIDGVPGGRLAQPQGRALNISNWGSTSTQAPENFNIAPTAGTQGLPPYRDSQVTALATAPNFLWAAIGGDTNNTRAAIWERMVTYNPDGSPVWHPRGWGGPIAQLGTDGRQVRYMAFSTSDDNTPRLHYFIDNGTAGDTDPMLLANITQDPRNVSGYAHTATGLIALPVNSRGLPELAGAWIKFEAHGTGLSATNYISAVYASADAAAKRAVVADWGGGSLGTIIASGGSVNFSATPSGTGQNAKAMQVLVEITGAGSASPYFRSLNIYVEKHPVPKDIYTFTLALEAEGSQRTPQSIIDDLEAIRNAITYSTLAYGEEAAFVVRPYWQGGKVLDYVNVPVGDGTAGQQTMVKGVEVEFEAV